MSNRLFSLKPLALAALVLASGASQASIAVYTTESSFLAAITAAATDTFNDLIPGQQYSGPLSRSAGAYTYTVSDGPTSPLLYGAGSASDAWLSTNVATDTITFSGFSTGVYAAGAYFFNSDIAGDFLRRGAAIVTATDTTGTVTKFKLLPTTSNYFGFVSTTTLTSLTVKALGSATTVWPTVNNLTLAAAVPEPETYALLLAGLGVVGFVARRRQR